MIMRKPGGGGWDWREHVAFVVGGQRRKSGGHDSATFADIAATASFSQSRVWRKKSSRVANAGETLAALPRTPKGLE